MNSESNPGPLKRRLSVHKFRRQIGPQTEEQARMSRELQSSFKRVAIQLRLQNLLSRLHTMTIPEVQAELLEVAVIFEAKGKPTKRQAGAPQKNNYDRAEKMRRESKPKPSWTEVWRDPIVKRDISVLRSEPTKRDPPEKPLSLEDARKLIRDAVNSRIKRPTSPKANV